jgi:ribosome-associated protein
VAFVLKKQGVAPKAVEGRGGGNWQLLDYGAVVVHIFLRDARDFYALEGLWSDAKSYTFDEQGNQEM